MEDINKILNISDKQGANEQSSNDKLIICRQCLNRTFDNSNGIICSLTKRKPDFEKVCPQYVNDPKASAKISKQSSEKQSSKSSLWTIIVVILIILKIIRFFLKN